MSLADLKAPRTTRTCVACNSFVAECLVPVGDLAAPMCWLCAHHVVDHECPVHEAVEGRCECKPEDIYPVRVLQARSQAVIDSAPGVLDRMAAGRDKMNDLQRRYEKHIPFIKTSKRLLRS